MGSVFPGASTRMGLNVTSLDVLRHKDYKNVNFNVSHLNTGQIFILNNPTLELIRTYEIKAS